MNAFQNHWREAGIGAASGSFAAIIVVSLSANHVSKLDLLVNSDVIGAAIGAGLAVLGARYLDARKQKSAASRARVVAKKTAIDLETYLTEYARWSHAYVMNSLANNLPNLRETIHLKEYELVDNTAVGWKSRDMFSLLQQAAEVFDVAANAVFAVDELEMLQISELNRLSLDAARGLDQIEIHVETRGNAHEPIRLAHAAGVTARRALVLRLRSYTGCETGIPYIW